jgi:hypothetical protein
MVEKENGSFDNLRELLMACHSMLEGADNGYDANSPYREVWQKSRDQLLKEIERALDSTAEDHPF